ncbi:hypothetical protein VTI74DRAFT_839 [Chaetomium olivicolor]
MTSSSKLILSDTPTPPDGLLTLLKSHLPYSLPVLRRLQFARNFPGGSTQSTHVLYAHYDDQGGRHNGDGLNGGHFAAACVDLSRAPETEVWIYSTLEDTASALEGAVASGLNGGAEDPKGQQAAGGGGGGGGDSWLDGSGSDDEAGVDLVLALLRRIRAIATTDMPHDDHRLKLGGSKNHVLVGSLHETLRQALLSRGVVMAKPPNVADDLAWEFCGKWLCRAENLPVPASAPLPQGMRWDRARKEDIATVLARTSINRKEATLLMLPSTTVRLEDGTPVAWAFMGLDGTITTLHVEEPYRQLGLAKAMACKLMHEHLPDYGDDGWGAADVFVENFKSQALCKSIGGRQSWTLSWAIIDLSSVGEPM